MIHKLKITYDLVSNMGIKYILFRIAYYLKVKVGWHKIIFPINPKLKKSITLNKWRNNLPPFFFYGKEISGLKKKPTKILENKFVDIINNKYVFFNKTKINLGDDYDWITNPQNNFKYDINKHWSEIEDLSDNAGDIKYVWEKSRFTFLYDIIRYDYHFQKDQSKLVFSEINDFINKNPINQGPNYKCSQEISLRVLNWTFALYYYKDSKNLKNDLFEKIMHSIYWHIHHVYNNINFSRISVRNNHALTETLLLYLSGKLFPFFSNAQMWSFKGKKWFEKEIEYQIYPDGTFLQFSMNYHRVLVQLLTWAIQLSNLNKDNFKNFVYERAIKSLEFLDTCLEDKTGELPNYGSNDGALFFKLNDDEFRNYKSQLDDLRAVIYGYTHYYSNTSNWYGVKPKKINQKKIKELSEFKNGGYYIINEKNTKTFIRCGSYKDRPFQSDNLHLDIWVNGVNYLRDNGSYKYNTNHKNLNYFNGTGAHNTVSVNQENQMLKGNRFIWYYWIKEAKGELKKENKFFEFNGYFKGFRQIKKNIFHKRIVKKIISQNIWYIEDSILNKGAMPIYQYWHLNPNFLEKIKIKSFDQNNNEIKPKFEEKWYSGYYGTKEKSIRITFKTNTNNFITKIKVI